VTIGDSGIQPLDPQDNDPLLTALRSVQHDLAAERTEREKAHEQAEEQRVSDKRNTLLLLLGLALFVVFLAWVAITAAVGAGRANNAAANANEALHQQLVDRVASRHAVCENSNEMLARIRKSAVALINVSAQSRAERGIVETEKETADRERFTKIYVEQEQGMRYVNGKVLAPFLDCNLFAESPAKAQDNPVWAEEPTPAPGGKK
jgi:ABC-type transport system involved in cytochrome bd biosynthesis fused ATPase/permease subunit